MKENFFDLVEVVRKDLRDNEMAALDRERLKKAKRVGLGCATKFAS
jgi:hypothetical protein